MFRNPVVSIGNTMDELINILIEKRVLTQDDISRLRMASMRSF